MKPVKLKFPPLGTALGLHSRGIGGGHALSPHSKLAKMSEPYPGPTISPKPIAALAASPEAGKLQPVTDRNNRMVPNAKAIADAVRQVAVPNPRLQAPPYRPVAVNKPRRLQKPLVPPQMLPKPRS